MFKKKTELRHLLIFKKKTEFHHNFAGVYPQTPLKVPLEPVFCADSEYQVAGAISPRVRKLEADFRPGSEQPELRRNGSYPKSDFIFGIYASSYPYRVQGTYHINFVRELLRSIRFPFGEIQFFSLNFRGGDSVLSLNPSTALERVHVL